MNQVLLLLSGALNITAGEETGSERERDLLKVTQQCLGWKAVALPSFCYTFDGQDVEGDLQQKRLEQLISSVEF